MMSLQCACCWPRDCGPSCRHAAARHARQRPTTLGSCCNVHGERWRLSSGCLTGCVLRTCWRVLLTGRHVVFMWHNPRATHLGHQQVRGECALLFISDAIHIIWHTIACCMQIVSLTIIVIDFFLISYFVCACMECWTGRRLRLWTAREFPLHFSPAYLLCTHPHFSSRAC